MNDRPSLVVLESSTTHINSEKTMKQFYEEICIDVLARTLWGEARGEGTKGMQAVANVILNRVEIAQNRGKFWWGNDIIQVCQKPYQFSCWNRSDPNFRKLQNVSSSDMYFATAVRIAKRAIAGTLEDITKSATHYHSQGCRPYWARDKKPSAEIGRHIFYAITRKII